MSLATSYSVSKRCPIAAKHSLSFRYGDELISFVRSERAEGAQRVQIKVHPDCRVVVHAPWSASVEQVLAATKKRARWIYKQLRDFRAQLAPLTARQYISGESHYYTGKRHVLKVFATQAGIEYVKLLQGKLEVSVHSKNSDAITALLNQWYKERAREVFARRLDAMLDQALWVHDRPTLRIQAIRTQWGSCSPQGRITLNPHLVKAPRQCIDYVILHELCHIAEHNHSKNFYRLMKRVMPDWERIKDRLDGMASAFLNV